LGIFEEGKRLKGKGQELLPMPHDQCPMPNAQQI